MADKIIAPIALFLFVGFAAFLAIYVNEPDLWIVLISVTVLAGYDFWSSLRGGNGQTG